ncbi:MAG TPA: hypothetical protein VGL86_19905 [Polyangia bacterium]|jgi:hypothetical protein
MQHEVDQISPEKLKKAVADATTHLDKAAEALTFLVSLTSEQRQHSNGKLKDGEDKAIAAIVETLSRQPAPFASLKVDPNQVTQLLQRRAVLAPLAEQATQLADDLTDTLLHIGEAIRGPVSSAYHVASALAPHDDAIAASLQPARQFYQATGRAAARTRKANKVHPPA